MSFQMIFFFISALSNWKCELWMHLKCVNKGRRHQISSSTYKCNFTNMFLKCGWIFDFSSWLFSLKYIGQFDEPLYVCLWKFGFFFIKETLSTLSSFNRLVNIWNKYSLALSNKAAINRGNATLFEIVLLPLHRTPIIHTMKVKAENWLNVCACLAAVCSGTKTCTFIINRMKKPNLCCDNGRRKHRKLNSLHLLPCNYLCHSLNVKIMLKDLFLKNDPAQCCEILHRNEDCGQTVLLIRSILKGRKLVQNAKIENF